MSTLNDPQAEHSPEDNETFGDLLSAFERTRVRPSNGDRHLAGTVVAISADTVFVDIGYKTEGVLPLSTFERDRDPIKVGDRLSVSSKGRNSEGYYELSRRRIEQPKDWNALEQAFAAKAVITGTVTAAVKGGLTVDIGVRAFMPASRSGAREAIEMEKLVGQEIRCRITKLDSVTEDVVVDRRAVSDEEDRTSKEQRYAEVKTGDVLNGTVRSMTDFGAFVDLGGIDGLLHIGEIAWARVNRAEDVLSLGQEIEVKVIKIDPDSRRISLSMKQLQPHPWEAVPERYKVGDRVRGTVTRVSDFGAFLEIEPGVEGLIHISEMSWGKKIRKTSDVLNTGDTAETVILAINVPEHRLSLGLKQALGDPWVEMAHRLAPGSVVEGEVTSFTTFGAFVQLSEGVQGLVHISEIVPDRRLNHPSDILRVGEHVKAKVLELDREKRQLRLSIKQMQPTGMEDFLAEHKVGDLVTGRILGVEGSDARIELGEGIVARCNLQTTPAPEKSSPVAGEIDLSSLTSMLNARWKTGGSGAATSKPQPAPGQIRSFTITSLQAESGSIELKLAD